MLVAGADFWSLLIVCSFLGKLHLGVLLPLVTLVALLVFAI